MNLRFLAVPVFALLVGSSSSVSRGSAPHEGTLIGNGQYNDNWDAAPRRFNEIQRRGFREGIEGAQKDIDNHREPNVNNRDEYRRPSVELGLEEQYREGFRNGYTAAMSHLMGGQSFRAAPPRPWDAPPEYWNDVQRRGFAEGIDGARKDIGNHRQPDVNNREEYRSPHVEPGVQEQYREGFASGYQSGMSHLMGGQNFQAPPPRPWDVPPDYWNDVQRRGFAEGIDGARKDIGNHRQPDVNNREEYRSPNVEPGLQGQYREGFASGYQSAMSHLMSGQNFQAAPQLQWDAPPAYWNEIEIRGFRDGIAGAQKDFDNHRRPDVNNRDEYRDPSVTEEMRNAYRAAFRQGYDRGMSHLGGTPR